MLKYSCALHFLIQAGGFKAFIGENTFFFVFLSFRMSVIVTVGVSLTLYSWLLCLIGTVLPVWTYQDQGVQYQHAGIWKTCTVHGGNADCKKITEGWIHTVQAFMILGVLVLFLSLICGCLRIKDESKTRLAALSTIAVLVGGFMVTIAVIVYGVKNGENKSKFSAGFYLSIISAVSAFLSALLFLASSKKRNDGYTPVLS